MLRLPVTMSVHRWRTICDYLISLESAEETGSPYTAHADLDLSTPCLEKDVLQMGGQTLLPSDAEESLLDVNNNPCFLSRRMEEEVKPSFLILVL